MTAKTTTDDTLPVHVPADTAPIPLIDTEADPWAGVGDGDLSPATTRSIPLLSLSRKEMGGFLDEGTGEKMTALDFIWLAKGTTRAWWPEAFGKGEKAPACRSADGIVPDPSSPDVQSQACATCPHAKWVGDDSPACKQSIEAMVFLPDPLGFGRLARIRLGGMAIAPAQAYWDSFSARLPRVPPIAYRTHVDLEPTETTNGTFLVPKFRRDHKYARSEVEPIIAERDRRIAEWTATVAEDVATGATRENNAAAPSAPAAPYVDGQYDGDDGSEPF